MKETSMTLVEPIHFKTIREFSMLGFVIYDFDFLYIRVVSPHAGMELIQLTWQDARTFLEVELLSNNVPSQFNGFGSVWASREDNLLSASKHLKLSEHLSSRNRAVVITRYHEHLGS